MPPSQRPELVINYAPQLNMRIAFSHANRYAGISLAEYRFAVDCRVLHPSGSFTYSASDLCFGIESFARFSEELHGLQQGLRQQAALSNTGEMLVLSLQGDSRALQVTLDVREYLAPSMATLYATFDGDYDLFVNKLRRELERFLDKLRLGEPSASE